MKLYVDEYDVVPITHTIECHIGRRLNRINKKIAIYIKKLYIEEDKTIEEISVITGKSVEKINKFLIENKLC